jgi:hypothetical protein
VCTECLGEARGECMNLVGLSAGKREILKSAYSRVSKSCFYSTSLNTNTYVISNYVVLIERTNKMQPCSRIYYSSIS